MDTRRMVRWEAYAQAYDLMAAYNPAYQENIERFTAHIHNWQIAAGDILIELGAGTGNYSTVLAEAFPQGQVWHVDSNPSMNAVAHAKARRMGLKNLRIIEEDVRRLCIAPRSIKGVICINALFCMPKPWQLIHRIYEWMRPQGYLYVDDIGRIVDIRDWFHFIFKSLYRRFGLIRSLGLIFKSRQVIIANRHIARAQLRGEFWTHDPDQFLADFSKAGFCIQHRFISYRGYNDGLIGRKPDLEKHFCAAPIAICHNPR